MKVKRKIIQIDEDKCTGCGQCIINCAEGALEIVNGKAKMVSDIYCDGLGACLGHCPEDALKIVEREAEEFDEKAVEHRLEELKAKATAAKHTTMPCGCPSSHIQTFVSPHQTANTPKLNEASSESALGHWPVQIRLIPPSAPFLKGAELLIAADCTPIAYADFHKDFLRGRTVMIGCPKFDDIEGYYEKFVEIFKQNDIKSITVLAMEVPCCSKLPMVVKEAIKVSGKFIPFSDIVIKVQGKAVQRQG